MKPAKLLLLTATLSLAADEPKKLGDLTIDGKTYENANMTAKRADGISIMHDAGTARIPYEKLPEKLREELGGFDPEAAKEARTEADRKEEAMLREIDAGVKANEARGAKEAATEALAASATRGVFSIDQVLDGGLLVREVIVTSYNVGSSNGNGRAVMKYQRRLAKSPVFVAGWKGQAAAEGETITGMFAKDGTYEFTDTEGAPRTVTRYRFIAHSK
jgi:hypothetical protein